MLLKKSIAGTLALVLLLTGCKNQGEHEPSADEIKAYTEGDYALRIPYLSNDARQMHGTMSRSLVDNFAIGSGLMEMSKDYFSTSTYAFQEGQFITYAALDAVSDGEGLLGRNRESNPYGLNPEKDVDVNIGDGNTLKNGILVKDVYEIDWYSGQELAGLSVCIVMQSQQSDADGNTVYVSEDALRQYGEEAARRVESFLRDKPEIGDSIPIYMTLYNSSSTDATLPGKFLSEAYMDVRGRKFTSVTDEWAIIPSVRSKELDINTWTQFTTLKESLQGFVPNDIEMIGKGHYTEKGLIELHIRLNIQAQGYTEAIALLQYFADQLSVFNSQSYEIKVEVYSNALLVGTIDRAIGQSEPSVYRNF